MNGTYYQNPTFPTTNNNYQETNIPIKNNQENNLYDILRNNLRKKANISINISNTEKVLSGIIEDMKDNIIILNNPETGNWFIILLNTINYIEFEETINTR